MKKFLPLLILLIVCSLASSAYAHAVAGDRVFPATLAIDDPGVSDELTLPQTSRFKQSAGPWETDTSAEFDKRLTENLGVSLSGTWVDQSATSGFDNFSLGAKYVFLTNAEHETMVSAGVDWDMGNTGAKRIADNFSTVTPALFFGKGLGDLPDSMNMVKPIAITGTLGYAMPTRNFSADPDTGDETRNPQAIEWGFTFQYSLPYLQQHVKDFDIAKPFANAIPLVEFSFETPTGGMQSERTTGTINPGVIFMGEKMQLGLEALIPANHDSGNRIGATAQLHFYLDDIFPNTLGKPLW